MKTTIGRMILMVTMGLAALTVQAQQYEVKGTVTDSLNQQSLAYATVVLQPSTTTLEMLSTMTDETGRFGFESVQDGLYKLRVNYLGYRQTIIDSVRVTGSQQLEFNIVVSRDAKLLKTVEISTVKPFIEQRADKLVLNVTESPIAAGGSAYDIITRAPGVIEQNGSFLIKGKSVTVLIDGKYTNMSGEELANMLSAMPSEGLDKVEVIANPSAKYDAQGGAVINILTTRNKNFGTNGSLTAGIGTGRHSRYNGGLKLNHRKDKINIYGSYNYSHSMPIVEIRANRVLAEHTTLLEDRRETRELNNNTVKGGVDFQLNKNNVLGVAANVMANKRDRKVVAVSDVVRQQGLVDSSSVATSDGKAKINIPSVNLYYKATLDTLGKELQINADYFSYNKSWDDSFTTRYYDSKGGQYRDPWVLQNHSPAQNTVKSISADYVQPIAKGSLEAGIKSTFTRTDNDIVWREQVSKTEWEDDYGKTNHFIYKENINAAYVSVNRAYSKVNLQIGVRAEQTNREGTSLTLKQTDSKSYINVFPSIDVRYNQSDKQQFSFAYRKKIDRFSFDVVNPFVTYVSQYLYFKGNPNAKPSISHNFEVSHSFNNSIITSLSYSRHLDVLAEVYRKDPYSQAIIGTDENISGAEQLDGNITLIKEVIKGKWSSFSTVGMMYAQYKATADERLNKAKPGVYVNSSHTLSIGNGWKGEASVFYSSPIAFGIYTFKPRFSSNLGISKSVLQDAGTVTLNVSDVFNTQENRYSMESFGVASTNRNKLESRFIKLSFTYKFGNKNVKGNSNRSSGIEDEKFRMESN